jgi:predicted nucleotidyltransferase
MPWVKRNLINVIFQMKRGKNMKKKDEILQILNTRRSYLKKVYGVRNIGLFGSYSRGEEGPDSDLDLLIEFDRPIGFFKFIELEDYLTEKLGIKVELVTKDALKPLLRPYIMKDIIYV